MTCTCDPDLIISPDRDVLYSCPHLEHAMFTTETVCTTLVTPADADVADRLTALIDAATYGVAFLIYGATDPSFFDALIRAHARGQTVIGIFDHSQGAGRTESAWLHRLFQAVPPANFRIGTSQDRQIMHEKAVIVNFEAAAMALPDAQYDDYRQALAAGYPVTWSGSYNFSPDAVRQSNHVDIMPGKLRAAAFYATLVSLWSWIGTNEPQYQPSLISAPPAPAPLS